MAVIILTLETVGSVAVLPAANPRYRGLTAMRTSFTCSLKWELRKGHGVYGTPGQVYTNWVPDQYSLYLVGQHTFAVYTKRFAPVRLGCCLDIAPELKCSRRAPGYFTLIGDKAPAAAHDSSEVTRA